jgi:hypothetical protein
MAGAKACRLSPYRILSQFLLLGSNQAMPVRAASLRIEHQRSRLCSG